MDTKQSTTSQGHSFGRGGNCLVLFATHFNPNDFFLILLSNAPFEVYPLLKLI